MIFPVTPVAHPKPVLGQQCDTIKKFGTTSPTQKCFSTPPFLSSAFCLLVAPYQVIGNCLSSMDSSTGQAAPSTCQAWESICQASTVDWYLLDRRLTMLHKCLMLLCRYLSQCLISSCQLLDKEQQANRKRLMEMVVYLRHKRVKDSPV